jgi:hypothetical protein
MSPTTDRRTRDSPKHTQQGEKWGEEKRKKKGRKVITLEM